jgi:hypothetical protein
MIDRVIKLISNFFINESLELALAKNAEEHKRRNQCIIEMNAKYLGLR